jgi:hypothetical protein
MVGFWLAQSWHVLGAHEMLGEWISNCTSIAAFNGLDIIKIVHWAYKMYACGNLNYN